MKIEVKRWAFKDTYTIGKMYIDGQYYCDTLEDKDRGLEQSMKLADIRSRKVYGKTAIPTGTYTVTTTWWVKHQRMIPLIEEVKGFSGILIHNGVTDADTLGCVLVGENRVKGKLLNGRKYMNDITERVNACVTTGEEVVITITH